MTEKNAESRRMLRLFLMEKFCGCGSPEDAAAMLLKILNLHPLYGHREEFAALVPDSGIEHLLLYMLDNWKLIEHGGSVGGAWLTDKGKEVRDALALEDAEGLEEVFGNHCIHGYPIEDTSHNCMDAEKSATSETKND